MLKILSFLLICLLSSRGLAQSANIELNISGNLGNNPLPKLIVIEKTGLGNYSNFYDTCSVTGNKFSYQSELKEPMFIHISSIWTGKKRTSEGFWAFRGTYEFKVDDNSRPTLSNAPNTSVDNDFALLESILFNHKRKTDSLIYNVSYAKQGLKQAEERITFLKDSMELLIDKQIYLTFALSHTNSAAGLYALCLYADRPYVKQRRKYQPKEIARLLDHFHPKIKELPSAKLLYAKLNLAKTLSVGMPFKNLSLPDTLGKANSIYDLMKEYTLIDFWASWCVPCREENPNLKAAYQRFKEKGFQVISVTIDKLALKKAWRNAIIKDKIGVWPQLCDFDGISANALDIRLIPANFLLDKNGVIVAKDLRGNEIKEKLAQLFNQ